ncbi:MAG: hypothetical protein AB1679_27665 [Actinomycetota bacterium]|jgi:hypothetical protein
MAGTGWGVGVDNQNKPQQTSAEDEATPATPAAPLQARSPYRPLSRRKRQEQVVEPPSAVERPVTSSRFDASPTRISAALAKAGASPEMTVLAWGPDGTATSDHEDDVEVEIQIEIGESRPEA